MIRESYRGSLDMPRSSEWNQCIRKVFEQRAAADRNREMLFGVGRAGSVPIEPSGSRRGHLRAGFRSHFDPQRKSIPCKDSSGHVVQMDQRRTIRLVKCTDHPPGRLLRIHLQARPLAAGDETQLQPGV